MLSLASFIKVARTHPPFDHCLSLLDAVYPLHIAFIDALLLGFIKGK